MGRGVILHDTDLRALAHCINKKYKIPHFEASAGWLKKFKHVNHFTSRRITKFVSRRTLRNRPQIEEASRRFVELIKSKNVDPECLYNADQSALTRELYTVRTLAPRGQRNVECIAQQLQSLTHSYTILPIIRADGVLLPKLYIVLAEPNGEFPQSFTWNSPNLFIECGQSHIMTKRHMLSW
ncbi:unnamed protein product, partial [Anisakis simplex]|uniref:HTH CENPB-type domain-containing protein n=1 Tax=Anisakis simplex TaxID=6269 RepID=A0A0M3JHP6_ANISI